MGTNQRKYDVKDILHKATTGWITPPNKPTMHFESPVYPYEGAIHTIQPDGCIFIRDGYDFNREKLSKKYENRIWTFTIIIIDADDTKVQGVFDQAREVFDRYTSAPWSTSTLGTSTTYDYAGIEKAGHEHDRHGTIHAHTTTCTVTLAEMFVDVVIA